MRFRLDRGAGRLCLLGLALALLPLGGRGEVVTETAEIAGIELTYRVVLPDGFARDRSFPAVLAFPGGGQTLAIVDTMIERNWRAQAETRGYIVISPAAPPEGLFFQGGDAVFPAFLDLLLERYPIDRANFHVAGISNGGASAFHVAARYPRYFISVTGMPGYLPYADDRKIEALADLCVYMHVGERDLNWIETMQFQAQQLTDADGRVRFWIEPDQGHVMTNLQNDGAARLFEHFEDASDGCRRQ